MIVCTREDGEPYDLDVLIHGGAHDLLRGLVQTRVDDLESRIPQPARNDLGSTVMTVEPGIYFIPALIDKWKAEKNNIDFVAFDKLDKYRDFGGVRIEDDILIVRDGARVLGKPIPKTAAQVEAAATV